MWIVDHKQSSSAQTYAQREISLDAAAGTNGSKMSLITVILLSLAALLGLIYAFLVWNFNYWRQRGIKSAKSWPLVGSFPSEFTQKRNLAYDIDDLYWFVGNVVRAESAQL